MKFNNIFWMIVLFFLSKCDTGEAYVHNDETNPGLQPNYFPKWFWKPYERNTIQRNGFEKEVLQTLPSNALILNIFKNIGFKPLANGLLSADNGDARNLEAGNSLSDQRSHYPQENLHVYQKPFSIFEQLKQDQEKDTVLVVRPKPFNILEQLQIDRNHENVMNLKRKPTLVQLKLNRLPAQTTSNQLRKPSKKKKKKKRKRKKKKKKKPTKNKNKRKKKKKKKPKQKQKQKQKHPTSTLVGQTAHVIFASVTEKPHSPHYYQPHLIPTTLKPITAQTTTVTTRRPYAFKKVKYILRKNNVFKKKKKAYLGHLKQVLYPFIKFIAFFTVLNPFTFGVFLFSLISPVVFGFLGFFALSFMIKPALHLLFDVKRRVGIINRRRFRERRKRERLRNNRRPITIHKHYYQHGPGSQQHQQRKPGGVNYHAVPQPHIRFNPILPNVRSKIRGGSSAEELAPFL